MNHPTDERLVAHLYAENPPADRREIETHLQTCAECEAKMQTWRQTTKTLDQWSLPEKTAQVIRFPQAWIRWAAAAVLFVSVGYATGRSSSSTPDLKALQTALEPGLRRQFAQEWQASLDQAVAAARTQIALQMKEKLDQATVQSIAASGLESQRMMDDLAKTFLVARAQDQDLLLQTLKKMETQRVSDLLALRQELETVAVLTDSSLRNAQRQIVRLASHTQPAAISQP